MRGWLLSAEWGSLENESTPKGKNGDKCRKCQRFDSERKKCMGSESAKSLVPSGWGETSTREEGIVGMKSQGKHIGLLSLYLAVQPWAMNWGTNYMCEKYCIQPLLEDNWSWMVMLCYFLKQFSNKHSSGLCYASMFFQSKRHISLYVSEQWEPRLSSYEGYNPGSRGGNDNPVQNKIYIVLYTVFKAVFFFFKCTCLSRSWQILYRNTVK